MQAAASLMNQTIFPQDDAYQLEIIDAPLEKVWSTAYTFFVLTDFVNY